MKKGMQGISALVMAGAFTLAMGTAGVSANEPGYGQGGGKDGYGSRGHGMMGGHGMGMMHSSAGHLIRHLLKHEKDIGLTADQVTKLKDIQLNLDKTRIKSEADIQVAEREFKALTDDEKSDLGAIEAKLKQSEDMQVALRMTSIKTRRDVLGAVDARTARQREGRTREDDAAASRRAAKATAAAWRIRTGTMQGNPHQGGATPMPPANMKTQ